MLLSKQNSPRHFLLVDDDPDDRAIFAAALRQVDTSVVLVQAEDGRELMNFLSINPSPLPDVIFLDLNMPLKNGFECLQEIRKQGNFQQLKIVLFSTSHNPDTIRKAFELGATFYAVKPDSFQELKSLIGRILEMDWENLRHESNEFQLS